MGIPLTGYEVWLSFCNIYNIQKIIIVQNNADQYKGSFTVFIYWVNSELKNEVYGKIKQFYT